MTQDKWIQKATCLHKNVYDYSISKFNGLNSKIKINCRIHGSFEMLAKEHINVRKYAGKTKPVGCPKCRKNPKKLTTEEFIERANIKYKGKYDYSLVNYMGAHVEVCIICPTHGKFYQTPVTHLDKRTKYGCQECGTRSKRESRKRSIEEIKKIVDQYDSLYELHKEESSIYNILKRRGIFDEFTSHMKRKKMSRGHWNNYEKCKKEAKKYNTRSEFARKSSGAYEVSRQNDWLDKICGHMNKCPHKQYVGVYVYFSQKTKEAYIGQTSDFDSRKLGHKSQKNRTTSRKIIELPDVKYKELTDYIYPPSEAKTGKPEAYWAEEYRKKGYTILNNPNNFGALGGYILKYTDEEVAEKASLCNSTPEFIRRFPKHYETAMRRGTRDEICSHMEPLFTNLTIDESIELAKTCENIKEFRIKYPNEYVFIHRRGWLQKIYEEAGLLSQIEISKEKHWLHPSAKKSNCCRADYFYNVWINNDKCGYTVMKNLTGEYIKTMIKYFENGWVPTKDKNWIEWSKQYKQDNNIKYPIDIDIPKNFSMKDTFWLKGNKSNWCIADYYYQIWIDNNKPGRGVMERLTGENLRTMIDHFKNDWIPTEDEEWKKWSQEYMDLSKHKK